MKITDIKFKEYNNTYWVQTTIKVDNAKLYTTNTYNEKSKAKDFENYLNEHKENPFKTLGVFPSPYIAYPKYEGKVVMELKATFVLYKLEK